MLDSWTWTVLAALLTLTGAVATVVLWRRRGPAAGLRGLAWTLVPVALWLTGTLSLVSGIAGELSRWASRLVFSPAVWLGVGVAGLSALLFLISATLRTRGIAQRRGGTPLERRRTRDQVARGSEPGVARAHREEIGTEDDEIEAILGRHGIR